MLDILHTPNPLPSLKKNTKSNFSIVLFVVLIITSIIYIIYRLINISKEYTINYTQNFQETVGKINKKITFGFKIGDNMDNYIKLEYYDSFNERIDDSLIKRCDSNLKEIKGDESSEENFFCFIDYPIRGSNLTNHIIKMHLKYKDQKPQIKRIPLIVKFIEPTIKHEKDNPFDYSELYEMLYFYDVGSATSYRKFIKVINYKTNGIFTDSNYDSAYLEDYEDISKVISLDEDDKMIGSFRFSLSKKKDIFERKFTNWWDFILDVISKLISIMGILSFCSLIMINPNDNLRIFYSLQEKKPSLYEPTSTIINEFWHEKNKNEDPNNNIVIPKKIKCKDKCKFLFGYYFCCCESCKKKELKVIDDFINEKLIINDTFENLIFEEIKNKYLKEKIKRIKDNTDIPEENRNSRNAIYNYLEPRLHNEFQNYSTEEIKIKIREIINEMYKSNLLPEQEMPDHQT